MLDEILEVYEFQGNLVKFEEVLKHFEVVMRELEED